MIDLSNLKAPGWAKVVADLSAQAPDDRAYMERLLSILAQVTAARQGVLWIPDRREGDEVEPRAVAVFPPVQHAAAEPGEAGVKVPSDAVLQAKEAKDAARTAITTAHAHVYGLDTSDQYYDSGQSGGGGGFIITAPLPGGGTGAGATPVVTLLIEPRSRDAVRSSLAMVEVLAGYVHSHAARQALRRTQQASMSLDLATRLIGSINAAPNFKGACMQLCNDLAKQLAVDRVALGWLKGRGDEGDSIRVEAISDTEHFDRRMAMVDRLRHAMDECFDQQQPVLYPPPPSEGKGGDVLLSQAITHAHRELASGDVRLRVCSVPLRIDESVAGVVTIESAGDGSVDLATIELIQSALDLVTPVLRIRRSDDRNLLLRAKDDLVKAGAWAVGPKHTGWKLAGVAALTAILFVTFFSITYRVGAEAVLEPRTRRIVSSPLEGTIKFLGKDAAGREIAPGSVVKKGDLLVQMDDTDWALRAIESRAKMAQAELMANAARKDGDWGKVEQSTAQYQQSKAEMDVYEYKVSQSKITAPIDGTIVGGRLQERLGGAVKLGDGLLEIAAMDDMIIVAKVDERDISLVTKAMADGRGKGVLAAKARPDQSFDFTVERIVPLSESKEGLNAFEVRAKLDGSAAAWMRPGMEVRARFDTERRSLLWIGTRRVIDAVRLWFW